MTTMETKTIKIWKVTLSNLRMIYALTGVKMVVILDRIVTQELKRIQDETRTQDQA
jgi:hypothetical protein